MATKHFCDRCGAEIEHTQKIQDRKTVVTIGNTKFDLCYRCANDTLKFMRGSEG